MKAYLDVPYSDRNIVKIHKARWSPEQKKWYAAKGISDFKQLARWTADSDRVFLNCPEHYLKVAKARGAFSTVENSLFGPSCLDKDNRLFIPAWYWMDRELVEIVSLSSHRN